MAPLEGVPADRALQPAWRAPFCEQLASRSREPAHQLARQCDRETLDPVTAPGRSAMHGNIMRARSIPEERGVTAPTLARRRRTSPGRIRVQAARASTLGARTLRLRLRRELEEPRRARGSPIAPVASRARPSRGGALRVEHGPSPTGPNRAEAKALADNADLIVQVLSIRDTTGGARMVVPGLGAPAEAGTPHRGARDLGGGSGVRTRVRGD